MRQVSLWHNESFKVMRYINSFWKWYYTMFIDEGNSESWHGIPQS